jgi:hypothetical protein
MYSEPWNNDAFSVISARCVKAALLDWEELAAHNPNLRDLWPIETESDCEMGGLVVHLTWAEGELHISYYFSVDGGVVLRSIEEECDPEIAAMIENANEAAYGAKGEAERR